MRAKTYFYQVLAAGREIRLLRAKQQRYYEIRIPGGLSTGSPPSGCKYNSHSRTEDDAINRIEITAALDDQIQRHAALIAEAQQIISSIPQERYRQILTLRYLENKPLRAISNEMGYKHPVSIYKAHGYALTEAQKILNRR